MSVEIWHSEAVIYGFIFLNLFATATVLVWAWRRGMFKNLDDTMRTSLDLPDSSLETHSKEPAHGQH